MQTADRHFSTGKRKTAVARVILRPGSGNILVNRRPYDQYFPRQASQLLILQPFEIVEAMGRYDIEAKSPRRSQPAASTPRRARRRGRGSGTPGC